jgi:hypothetical protein
MVSAEGQNAIRSCRIQGRQLFFPDAAGCTSQEGRLAATPPTPRKLLI